MVVESIKKLLAATDRAARRTKRNRSALVRDALREHLRKLEIRAREERDREGYAKDPPDTPGITALGSGGSMAARIAPRRCPPVPVCSA